MPTTFNMDIGEGVSARLLQCHEHYREASLTSLLQLRQKNNDLYKFQQSAALDSGTPGAPCLQQLRARLLDTVRVWVAGVLGLELEPDTVDLFCAKYRHTDTLLCHDDELEVE